MQESGAVPVSLPESPLTGGGTGGVRERESSLSPGTSLQPSVLLEVTKLLHLLSGLDPLFLQYYLELLKVRGNEIGFVPRVKQAPQECCAAQPSFSTPFGLCGCALSAKP